MAVYTPLTDMDMHQILQSYKIGTLQSYQGITEGVENTNYFLHTTHNTFVLTIFEKRVNGDDLPYFLNLMNHMNTQGIVCPQVIFDTHGNALQTVKGKPAIIISFLRGKSLGNTVTEESCYKMGEMLAKMHRATENFTMHRPNDLNLLGWKKYQSTIGADMPKKYAQLVQTELDFQQTHTTTALPQGAIHADVFVDNVFFENGNISGVIDFYFGCNDAYVYDLAITLTAWCFDTCDAINMDKAKSMMRGYQSIRLLTDLEWAYLPVGLRGASLRFMLTRLYDVFHTPEGADVVVKDPSEYADKLVFYRTTHIVKDLIDG